MWCSRRTPTSGAPGSKTLTRAVGSIAEPLLLVLLRARTMPGRSTSPGVTQVLCVPRERSRKYGVMARSASKRRCSARATTRQRRLRWRSSTRDGSHVERRATARMRHQRGRQLNRPGIPPFPASTTFRGRVSQGAMAARRRPARQARRARRHGRERDADRSGAGAESAERPDDLPALAALGARGPEYFRPVCAAQAVAAAPRPVLCAWYRFRCSSPAATALHAGLRSIRLADPGLDQRANERPAHAHRVHRARARRRQDLRRQARARLPAVREAHAARQRWFRTLHRDNVELVTDRDPRGDAERGIATERGALHELDAIVFATGFQANRFLSADGDRGPRRALAATRNGATTRARTSASPCLASRTCSACTDRTRTSPTAAASSSTASARCTTRSGACAC